MVEESGPTAKALTQAAHKVKAHIDSNLQQVERHYSLPYSVISSD